MRSATGWRRPASAARSTFDVLSRRARSARSRSSSSAAPETAPRDERDDRAATILSPAPTVANLSPRVAERAAHAGDGDRRRRHRRRATARRRSAFGFQPGDIVVEVNGDEIGRVGRRCEAVAGDQVRAPGASTIDAAARSHPRSSSADDATMADLFAGEPRWPQAGSTRPLADRLRPQTLAEVIGQEHLTGHGRRADAHDRLGLARLDDLLGAARHRQDHRRPAARGRDGAGLRADLGDLLRRRRSEEGVRGGARCAA